MWVQSPERRWSTLLDRAERLLAAGRPIEAEALAQQVFDDATEERKRYALGTEARWACTRTISRATLVLLTIARRAYDARAS